MRRILVEKIEKKILNTLFFIFKSHICKAVEWGRQGDIFGLLSLASRQKNRWKTPVTFYEYQSMLSIIWKCQFIKDVVLSIETLHGEKFWVDGRSTKNFPQIKWVSKDFYFSCSIAIFYSQKKLPHDWLFSQPVLSCSPCVNTATAMLALSWITIVMLFYKTIYSISCAKTF